MLGVMEKDLQYLQLGHHVVHALHLFNGLGKCWQKFVSFASNHSIYRIL